MKILNLYAGIGGNRKLWGNQHEITAVEIDPAVAANYFLDLRKVQKWSYVRDLIKNQKV